MKFTQAISTPITVLAVRALSQVFASLLQVAVSQAPDLKCSLIKTAIFYFRRPPERLSHSLLWRQRRNGQLMWEYHLLFGWVKCVHQDKTSKHKLVEVASCSSAPRCKNVFYIDAQHVFLAASHLSQKCFIGSNGITFPLGYARKRMGYEIDFYCWFGFFC